jgi:hypothetical protein
MNLCEYVEAHHEDWGVALFIIPALLAGLAIVGVWHCVAWLFH